MLFVMFDSDAKIDDECFQYLDDQNLLQLVPALGPRIKLKRHIDAIREGQVFVCFLCKISEKTYKDLLDHLNSHSNLNQNSIYECIHCKSKLNRHAFLKHMRNFFKFHKDQVYSSYHSEIIHENDHSQIELEAEQLPDLGVHQLMPCNREFVDEFKDLKQGVAVLMSTLLDSGKLPMKTTLEIITCVRGLVDQTIVCCKSAFGKAQVDSNTCSQQLNQIQSIFNDMTSTHKLNKFLLSDDSLIVPQQLTLDTDLIPHRKGEEVIHVYRPITMQYVPISETIKKLFSISGFYKSLSFENPSNTKSYSHFRDGNFYKSGNFERDTIFINLYYDDVEVGNPLGSKAGKNKLGQFYFTIIDMPGEHLSKLENHFLVASLRSEDMKLFENPNPVISPMVKELTTLFREGIQLELRELGVPKVVKVALAQFVGDNLGLHSIFGFTEGFKANYACRRCKMRREDCQKAIKEDVSLLRNVENYKLDLELNSFSNTGIKFESVLNDLPYHHVTKMYAFDIMHDILEGVGPDWIRIMFEEFQNNGLFDLSFINARIKSFDYGRHYSESKPSLFRTNLFQKGSGFGQNSSQTLSLLVNLPVMLSDIMDDDNHFWQNFLILRTITQILFTPIITNSLLILLDKLISEFLDSYLRLTNKTLKPKHHHLTHYVSSIRQIGPLKLYWSMRYESLHKFFKQSIHSIGNYKSVPKTVSYRFQLQRCFQLMRTNRFATEFMKFTHSEACSLQQLQSFNIQIQYFPQINNETEILLLREVEYHGFLYKPRCFLILSNDEGQYKLGKIIHILKILGTCYFLLSTYSSSPDNLTMCLKINDAEENVLSSFESLLYKNPFYAVKDYTNNDFIPVPFFLWSLHTARNNI